MISLRAESSLTIVATVLTFALIPGSLPATTWYVPSPCPTIQAGIDSAAAGDTVEVACGTYSENGIVMKSGVHLRSQHGQADCVTIDAGLADRVLNCLNLDTSTMIVGFTITGGSVPPTNEGGAGVHCQSCTCTLRQCDIVNNAAGQGGGGVFITDASPRLESCRLLGNSAPQGGAILCKGASSPVFSDCLIAGNTGTYGGGIRCKSGATPQFLYSTIVGNLGTYGGALNNMSSSGPSFILSTIASNNATELGGSVYCNDGSTPSFTSTILWGNCAPLGRELYFLDAASSASFFCCDVDTASGWKRGPGVVTWSGTNYSTYPIFCAPQLCSDAPFTASCSDEYSVHTSSVCALGNNDCGNRIGACGSMVCIPTVSPEPVLETSTWSRVKAAYR